MSRQSAFTLIELLVVVTIIVVLLALLAPAMDKAIYEAELARCAAQLKQIGSAATTYAVDFRRWYPHRPTVHTPHDAKTTTTIRHGAVDDRPVYRDRIPLSLMLDPLVPKVDLYGEAPHIQSSFTSLWFGTRYPGHMGMAKLGDRFEWTTTGPEPRKYAFNLLASDSDYFLFPNGDGFASTSHMDENNSMALNHYNDSNFISSYWYLKTPTVRGAVDLNYALADGSILRLNKVKTNLTEAESDDRVVPVPFFYSAWDAVNVYQQVPRP